MHVFATITQANGSNFKETCVPLIRALFSRSRTAGHGPYYFVRTWDARTSADVLHISIDGTAEPDHTIADLQRLAREHGCTAEAAATPAENTPSPLWNAGFSGRGFSDSSRRLFQKAAPILVAHLNRSEQAKDPLASTLDVLRLMAAHSRATLLGSPQREIERYEFRDLLPLRLLSYRSHYEAVYLRTKDPDSFEAACSRFYEQVGPTVREFIEQCGGPDTAPMPDPLLEQWTELATSESRQLADDFASGALVNSGQTLEDLERKQGGPVAPTRFHIPPIPETEHLIQRDPDFMAFRLLTSLMYSCLYSLGFSLAERYVFCYVLARANEEACGKSMTDLRDDLDALAKAITAAHSTTP
ncbi:hypothetical protein DSC45_00915 [Streptomyces sp. YIM 130001]|uniref:hypothetical protein n=1 Tax=Streptomyces sp. YIM 130001 TaxID=2259644 RepID=UPI000EB8493B|nr:hypothetical protein [Streptomyces sp. YIM 130001]RII22271.1 hypothetical protein DSC45_00915 [Streptomyces sp. YIM 130001]